LRGGEWKGRALFLTKEFEKKNCDLKKYNWVFLCANDFGFFAGSGVLFFQNDTVISIAIIFCYKILIINQLY
jgi:hypothetical protein